MTTWLFVALAAAVGADAEVAADRMFVIDGQRTFLLGFTEVPEDEAVLQRVAESGVNLIRVQSPDEADRAWRHGLYALAETGYAIDLSKEAATRKAALDTQVQHYARCPGFIAWLLPDEALWNVWYLAQQWRFDVESAAQRKAIEGLTDAALKSALNADYRAVQGLYSEGRFAEGESRADALSVRLGLEAAKPNQYISTAAQRSATMADGMALGYRHLKSIDPKHLVWINHAPRNSIDQLALFGADADAVGCDIYPIPDYLTSHADIQDRSRVSVGDYTQRMQASAPGKPVVMVLQGFGWPDLPEAGAPRDKSTFPQPTRDALRFMAYDCIVNGARGIAIWGAAFIEKDSQLWGDILATYQELSDLQPILSAKEPKLDLTITYEETWGSVDRDVKVLPKQTDDGLALIVVNEWRDPLACTIKGLPDGTYTDVHGGEEITAKDGLTLHLPQYGIKVLRIAGTAH